MNNVKPNSSSNDNSSKDKPNPLKLVTPPRIPTKEQRDDGSRLVKEIRGGKYDRG